MTTRRRPLALVLVLLATGLVLWTAPRWSAGLLERGMTRAFGRAATVGRVRFHVVPPSVEILDVRVAGPTPGSPPFLEVPRVVAVPGLSPLWVGDVALSRLLLQEPRVRVHAFAQGGDDFPRFRRGGPSGFSASVRRLVIDRGEITVNHERIPLELDLPSVRGRLTAGKGGVLTGTVAFGPGDARFGDARPLPLAVEMDLILDGADVTVAAAHVTAQGTDVAYSGRLRVAAPLKGSFDLTGIVDLGVLDRYVLRTGFDLAGAGRYDGRLAIEGSAFHVEGRMEGQGGSFEGVDVPQFRGRVVWQETGVRISDLEVETLGGTARLDLEVPRGHGRAHVEGHLEGVDAEGLLRPLFGLGVAGVDAAATGSLELGWPRGRIRHISGAIHADLVPRGDGRTPTSGRFEWTAADGVQDVQHADFKTPSTWVSLAGRVGADDSADLSVELQSQDLAATDDLGVRVRRALGSTEATLAGLGGEGTFRGRWRGTLGAPVFDGRFSGKNVAYLGVTWGSAEWAGVATEDDVVSHSLVIHRPGGDLWVDGRAETGEYAKRDGLDLRLRFRRWPSADFLHALDWHLPVDGLVSGDGAVSGRRSAPSGAFQLEMADGRWYAVPFSRAAVKARLEGDRTVVESGRAMVGGGQVEFRGALTDAGDFDASAEAHDVDVADVLPRPTPAVQFGGKISATLSLQGPRSRPKLTARVASPHLFLGDEGIGAVEGTMRGDGDGEVEVDLRCHSARVDLTATGRVAAEPPYAIDLRGALRDSSIDPFLREVYETVPGSLGIVATGDFRVQGPLARPHDIAAEIVLPAIEVGVPELVVRSREPVRARVQEGRLQLEGLHLVGEDTDLAMTGTAILVGDGPLDFAVRGSADLALAGLVSRRLIGRGEAALSVHVAGTRQSPRIEGRLDLAGAGIRVRGFPHGLEDVRGTVRFNETSAQLEDATGVVAGGAVSLTGQAAYGGPRPASFDLRATGHAMSLRYPEGLRSVVDADIRLFGDAKTQWMTGDVDVRQALWTRRYDVASELLASAAPPSLNSPFGGSLRFDMKVRVPGTLTVDNNLATLTARADLTLQGTDDAPAILGRAEIDHGRVYFQGNTYLIRRGTIDFVNPQKIDPVFDIEADARVRTYRVTLKVNGTLQRVYPTLTSDPPLTAIQILNVLAGADETTVAGLQSQADEAKLAAAGAATLAAGKIAEEVGLARGAERLGLSRFSIDPSVIRGGTVNPTARITLGKRITPDLSVQYSLDLRSNQDRILSVEYTLSDRLSVLLTSSQTDGLGFDVEMRHSR